jgi:hypothetical protein
LKVLEQQIDAARTERFLQVKELELRAAEAKQQAELRQRQSRRDRQQQERPPINLGPVNQ